MRFWRLGHVGLSKKKKKKRKRKNRSPEYVRVPKMEMLIIADLLC